MKNTDFIDMSNGVQSFEGLVPAFGKQMGEEYMTGKREGATDYLEVVDCEAVKDYIAENVPTPEFEGQFASFDEFIVEEALKEEPGPGPEPTPVPTEATWFLVKDAESWQEAKDNGALARYYEDHPEEDLWNGKRKNNFNDAMYAVTIFSDAAGQTEVKTCQFKPTWGEQSQKLTDEQTGEVFYAAMFYSVTEDIYELFTDAAMTESANIFMKVTEKTFPGFENAYEAVDLAVQPWAVIAMEEGFEGKVIFEYEGNKLYPFGNADRKFTRGYGIVNLPVELGIPSLAEVNPSTFEKESLKVMLLAKA